MVLETLQAGKWPIYEIRLAKNLSEDELNNIRRLAEDKQVPYVIESGENLTTLCGSQEHQGYLAKMPPYPYDDINTLEKRWPDCALILVLDGIQDPYNFGAILRSAEVLGTDAVLVRARHQSEVTSLVARSSAGAVNSLSIIKVPELAPVVANWKERGVTVLGASEKAKEPVDRVGLTRPVTLVIGSEGAGIRPELLAICDNLVTIPQSGRVGSLNAAVSAGILLYEVHRQRRSSLEK